MNVLKIAAATALVIFSASSLAARPTSIVFDSNAASDDGQSYAKYIVKCSNGKKAELTAWENRIIEQRDMSLVAITEGKVHLLHMVLGNQEILDTVVAELAAGTAFTTLAVSFSSGGGAAKGGDIGWLNPQDMVEPMRSAIVALEINETSPPVEAGGLFHIFKRIP